MNSIPGILGKAALHKDRQALIGTGQVYSYAQLVTNSYRIAGGLVAHGIQPGDRIAILLAPSFEFIASLFGVWRAGAIAVPLSVYHPGTSQTDIFEDAEVSVILTDQQLGPIMADVCRASGILILSPHTLHSADSLEIGVTNSLVPALILYTSGTTSKPKGVVITHGNIEAQILSLVEAWELRATDYILCVLPLNHIHGLVVAMASALWSGACCEFLPFDARKVFEAFLKGRINVFMGVPTVYYRLIQYFDSLDPAKQSKVAESLKKFRLMTCGSAALPVSMLDRWKEISGHTLLERYGMTEIGMGLSNPYNGERRPGYVGQPLPGVSVRLVDDEGKLVDDGESGEIQVKGANVFGKYWRNPRATEKAFTDDRWFKTGDISVRENGSYRIVGRDSIDIIKSGGHKISAFEIEEALRKHRSIDECAVVGIPDEQWGEIIGAALIGEPEVHLGSLQNWLKSELPSHMLPRKLVYLKSLPRNVLGKVIKTELGKMFDD